MRRWCPTAPGRPRTASSPTSPSGAGCGQLKSGAPARGERVAKYNRLLEIADSDPDLAYGLSEAG